MKKLYADHGLKILHDAAHECLLVEWHGEHNNAQKQAGCLTVAEHVRATRSKRMLVDGSHDMDTWASAVCWLSTEYLEILVGNGLQALAWVLPRYLRARADANEVIRLFHQSAVYFSQRLLTDNFQDVEAAHSWLFKVALPPAAAPAQPAASKQQLS